MTRLSRRTRAVQVTELAFLWWQRLGLHHDDPLWPARQRFNGSLQRSGVDLALDNRAGEGPRA